MGAYGPPAGFYRNKPRVKIDGGYCTGCLACLRACPSGDVLTTVADAHGERHAAVADPSACAGCGRCVRACSTHAIGLYLV